MDEYGSKKAASAAISLALTLTHEEEKHIQTNWRRREYGQLQWIMAASLNIPSSKL